ncbi:uncharacterized protein B0I36DRAFT_405006 [Microdochium trichocladiopsis]|uniref:FAD-binding PCMH-type domain-containing protein n=1 Tax=Microdochium trichocladiopsis TaxID=1682393 RepID=A0A9P8YAZ4_9PEZI|nr:uncharacterized protein B0I36DRAFT_405006 [Microdochium trichocladiopsis]KAH7034550.1 hypothetical protein B0I36DRAFT_405006 [Microdochium trichocladiopsis]
MGGDIPESRAGAEADILSGFPAGIPIYHPSDPKFHELRLLFNLASTNTAHPLAVVRPRDEQELATAVKFCASAGVPMTIRAGGHDLQMRNARSDAVMIDMRELDTVRVVEDDGTQRRHAVIGGGSLIRHVWRTLEAHGLTTPGGWCISVGYAGWAAGGGYGLLGSYYGAGADQILGARVVTPRGEIVDTDDDPELLWALRGAGLGNFGVVLELRVKVYPQPRVLAGLLVFPFAEARQVLGGLEDMYDQGIPSALAAEASTRDFGPAVPAVVVFFHWILDGTEQNAAEGQEYLAKYRALGTVVADTVSQTTTLAFCEVMDTTTPYNTSFYFESVSVSGLSDELIDAIAASPAPEGAYIVIHHAHGKMLANNDDDDDDGGDDNTATAYCLRDRHYVLGLLACRDHPGFTSEEGTARIQNWAEALNREIRDRRKLALGHCYWSFTKNEDCDVVAIYGEEGVARLRALKNKYNPGNAFPGCYPVL